MVFLVAFTSVKANVLYQDALAFQEPILVLRGNTLMLVCLSPQLEHRFPVLLAHPKEVFLLFLDAVQALRISQLLLFFFPPQEDRFPFCHHG